MYTLVGGGPPPTYAFRYAVNGPQQFWNGFCGCLTADIWTHVTAVVDSDAGTLQLYVGGGAARDDAGHDQHPPRQHDPEHRPLDAAATGRRVSLLGALDDIAIYNRALGPEEIAALGAAPAPNPK